MQTWPNEATRVGVRKRQGHSGAWLLQITAKGRNLISQLLGAGGIATGEGYGQGKLQLFALMVAFGKASLSRMATGQSCTDGRCCGMGARAGWA
jgi:hypothetical protein